MPSPIAHSAAGFAIFQTFRTRLPAGLQKRVGTGILLFIGLSLAPDLDLVPAVVLGDLRGIHNGVTNSLLVGLLASGVLAGILARLVGGSFPMWFAAAYVCIGLHILMDYFTAARGVMAFWPITSERYVAPVLLFYGFHYSDGPFSVRHLWTALTESLFAAAVALLALYLPRLARKLQGSALH